ncbi:hypothetical protein D3C71_98900 [compost metagenome]
MGGILLVVGNPEFTWRTFLYAGSPISYPLHEWAGYPVKRLAMTAQFPYLHFLAPVPPGVNSHTLLSTPEMQPL